MKKEKYHFSAKMVPVFLVLHLALVISSLSGVCSKMAARQEFLSWGFVFWFGMVLGGAVIFVGIYLVVSSDE